MLFSVILLFLMVTTSLAGDLKKIAKKIEKGDYEKAVELIQKSIADEPINPGAKYYYSKLFLNEDFPNQDLDSARIYLKSAQSDYTRASIPMLKEMTKQQIGGGSFDGLHAEISQLSFEHAQSQNSVEGWTKFLAEFPSSDRWQEAINARDSLVFEDVKSNLTIERLEMFLGQYPESVFITDANKKLDSLVVLEHQNEGSVEELEKFINENPESELVEGILQNLLKWKTLSGTTEDFISFAKAYRRYDISQRAINILFHLDRELQFTHWSKYANLASDSLRKVKKWPKQFRFPILKESFRLVGLDGSQIATDLDFIDDQILCEGLDSDVFSGRDRLGEVIRNLAGSEVIRGKLVRDIGSGFLIVDINSELNLVHKSGELVLGNIEDAEVLDGRFLKVRKQKWRLYALTGYELAHHEFDDIFIDGNFWFFEKDGLLGMSSPGQIVEAFPDQLQLKYEFEEYELLNDDLMIGYRGEEECMISSDGSVIVTWGEHQIYPDEIAGYVKEKNGYFYYNEPKMGYDFIGANKGMTIRKEGSTWTISPKLAGWKLSFSDTVQLIGDWAGWVPSEQLLVFSNGQKVRLEEDQIPTLLPSSTEHIQLKSEDMTRLYGPDANLILSGNFQEVSLLTDTLLAVNFRGKTGLITAWGDELLPIKYDYLSINDNIVTLLKDNKIGALDVRNMTLIEPEFDARIERLGEYYLTGSSGNVGLVDSEGEMVVPFEYDRIFEWNDTLVWVQSNQRFQLLNLNNLVPERTVTLLTDFPLSTGRVKKFYSQNGFGLIGAQSGILLEPNFSDIRIIGTVDHQIIVAEQSLTNAGFKVLTYFDASGNKLHSQAYTPDEYDRVLCDD